MVLKVVLNIDCEKFISFGQVNPRWNFFERIKGRINNLIKNYRYNERGFDLVLKTLERSNFPATLMIVGSQFSDEEISKIPKILEIGYHTKNHLPLNLIDDKKMLGEIKNELKVKSFTAPMWMIEDLRNPSRIFEQLKKEGYTHVIYRGSNQGVKHEHFNTISRPIKKYGITLVRVSACFEGNSNKNKIEEIKKEISQNLKEDKIYLISTHDFTHKNNKNLMEMLKFLKYLERDKKIEIKKIYEV